MQNLIKTLIVVLIGFSSVNSFGQSFMDRMKQAQEEKTVEPAQPQKANASTDQQTKMRNPNKPRTYSQAPKLSRYKNIKNRWQGTYIHNENGHLEDGKLGNQGWHSAQWELVPASDEWGYMKIKNRWKGTYLHVENGFLTDGHLGDPGWHSAQWVIEYTSPDSKYVRFKNRWTGTYIHNQTGRLVAGRLGDPGWHSAHWQLVVASEDSYTSSTEVAGNDFSAMNRKQADMYFRYTDQVSGGGSLNLKVGDRIQVLPDQTISDSFLNKVVERYQGKVYYGKSGLSFDAKKPKICGKIFTVKSVSPLKFTEEFPEKMRNTSNSNFKFKVIKL